MGRSDWIRAPDGSECSPWESVRRTGRRCNGQRKTHEELYIIIKGEGLYQVDGEIFPVREGTVIRVSPDGKRALKNNGQENLTMLCIQYKANAFGEADSPMTDGNILQEPLNW